MSLFHDGEVCRKVGIKYVGESKTSESCNHLTLAIGSDGIAEFFSDSRTYGRSGLYYNLLGGVCESCEYSSGLIYFGKSAGGASVDTLSAVYAGSGSKLGFKCATDLGVKTSVISADNADSLNLSAYCRAAAAKDTLAVVTNDSSGGVIDLGLGLIATEVILVYTVLNAKLLELTVGGTGARETLLVVVGKKELKVHFTHCANLGSIGKDLGAVTLDGIYTSCNGTSCAYDFNKAQTASANLVDILKIAEGGDINVCHSCSFEDGGTVRNAVVVAIDFYIDHFGFHSDYLLSLTAWKLP